MSIYRILTINPGSTSTKIGVFENEKLVFEKTIRHSNEELAPYGKVAQQFAFRRDLILSELQGADYTPDSFDAIVGRGGLVKPIESGIYEINDRLIADLLNPPQGEHASNLGGLIAEDLSRVAGNGVRAYIADPVVVDELEDVARITGLPGIRRVSIFHALNQKAVANNYAASVGKRYDEMNLIVAHMGGGISVGAHRKGRVIDVNNAVDGDGPFSPERSGGLPAKPLAELCFSGAYTLDQVYKLIAGKGGIVALLGTNDMRGVREAALAGDEEKN